MILNVSGRTDVIVFYTQWFINRYQEGFLDVRNPFYPKQVSRIYFEDVDLIVFCTKNPIPILKHLKTIKIPIIFQITLTPYKKDIEPYVPPKGLIIKAIKKIANLIGSENIYIRYDPIFLSSKYSLEYHQQAFANMCKLLDGYTKHIIVSFMDEYKNVKKNKKQLKYRQLTEKDYQIIGSSFSKSAKEHHMTVQTCYEKRDLTEYGFIKGECLSRELAHKLTGKTYKKWSARKCNCAQMVDIGTYNSCKHFCKYCYANFDEKTVNTNFNNHDPNSTLITGNLQEDDIIKRRTN